MSSATTGARSNAARPQRSSSRSRMPLQVVPERSRAPGRAFVLLLVAVLAAGVVGLLVLNTAMQRAAFSLESLNATADRLEVRRQVLELQVDRMSSPEVLGRRATELGMVPMTTPVFLRLSDGKVLGDPQPAVAGVGPQLVVLPAPPASTTDEDPPTADPAPRPGQQQNQQQDQQQDQHQDQLQDQQQNQDGQQGQQSQGGAR